MFVKLRAPLGKKKIATCISSLTLHLNINTKYTYKCSYSNTVEAFTWS